ncbi:MAG: carbon-nitrogen hydrolase [Bacteroidaceae bacterium]|nr:carbon-nitrogen hydrolase [Bacteroidaceae bacterium]
MGNDSLNIGIIQQHNTADMADNKARLEYKIRSLAKQGAELIVLQELHNSLYFCQEENTNCFDMASPIPGPDTEWLAGLARECKAVLVGSLFERRAAGLYHNTAVVLDKDGSICGKYRKMHIPDDPGYYEKFYFTPGDLGFQPIQTSVGRLGVMVCWDQWYPEAARIMAMRGAELLIYPTAIGYDPADTADEQERQREAWTTVQRGHAVANGLPVVAVNRVGIEKLKNEKIEKMKFQSFNPENREAIVDSQESIVFWGSSFVAGPQGEMLYRAPKDEEAEAVVRVSISRSEEVRRWWPFLRDRRIEEYDCLTKRFDD